MDHSLAFEDLPDRSLLLVDSAPIINVLEGHPKLGPRFIPLFEAHARGRLRFAVTTKRSPKFWRVRCKRAMRRWRGVTGPSFSPGSRSTSPPRSRKAPLGCAPPSA